MLYPVILPLLVIANTARPSAQTPATAKISIKPIRPAAGA
jgi:hypothetical protein